MVRVLVEDAQPVDMLVVASVFAGRGCRVIEGSLRTSLASGTSFDIFSVCLGAPADGDDGADGDGARDPGTRKPVPRELWAPLREDLALVLGDRRVGERVWESAALTLRGELRARREAEAAAREPRGGSEAFPIGVVSGTPVAMERRGTRWRNSLAKAAAAAAAARAGGLAGRPPLGAEGGLDPTEGCLVPWTGSDALVSRGASVDVDQVQAERDERRGQGQGGGAGSRLPGSWREVLLQTGHLHRCTVRTMNVWCPIYKRLEPPAGTAGGEGGGRPLPEAQFPESYLERNRRILQEVLLADGGPDCLCLQEYWVQNRELTELYLTTLRDAGYRTFTAERPRKGDGLLTAVKASKYAVRSARSIVFGDVANRVGLMLHLSHSDCTSAESNFLLVNVHLLFPHNDNSTLIRLREVSKVLEFVHSYIAENDLKDCPVVVAGDFNGKRGYTINNYMTYMGFKSSYCEVHGCGAGPMASGGGAGERPKEVDWISHRDHREIDAGVDFIYFDQGDTAASKRRVEANWHDVVFCECALRLTERGMNVADTLEFFDRKNNGVIDVDEFSESLKALGFGDPDDMGSSALSTTELESLMLSCSRGERPGLEGGGVLYRSSRGLGSSQKKPAPADTRAPNGPASEGGGGGGEGDLPYIRYDELVYRFEAAFSRADPRWKDRVLVILNKLLQNMGLDAEAAFKRFDSNGSGRIEREEFRQAMGALGLGIRVDTAAAAAAAAASATSSQEASASLSSSPSSASGSALGAASDAAAALPEQRGLASLAMKQRPAGDPLQVPAARKSKRYDPDGTRGLDTDTSWQGRRDMFAADLSASLDWDDSSETIAASQLDISRVAPYGLTNVHLDLLADNIAPYSGDITPEQFRRRLRVAEERMVQEAVQAAQEHMTVTEDLLRKLRGGQDARENATRRSTEELGFDVNEAAGWAVPERRVSVAAASIYPAELMRGVWPGERGKAGGYDLSDHGAVTSTLEMLSSEAAQVLGEESGGWIEFFASQAGLADHP